MSAEYRLKHFINIYPGTIAFQYLKMVFTIEYSTLSLTGSQLIFLKCDGSVEMLEVNLGKNVYICFEFFED